MSLITITPTVDSAIRDGESARVTLTFGFDAGGSRIIGNGGPPVWLVAYDLDQYLTSQSDLPGAFRELNTDLFTGRATSFPGPLQGHDVAQGTGVLFAALLTFEKRSQPLNGGHWFVKQVLERHEHGTRAYDMRVVTFARVDDSGAPNPTAPIELQPIGVVSSARADFEKLLRDGRAQRNLAFRLLDASKTRVLVSSLNPEHCLARIPKRVTYTKVVKKPAIGGSPSADIRSTTFPPRASKPDATGFYVEQFGPVKEPVDALALLSPAGLWIHQVGKALCGWYYPIPSLILLGKRPISNTRLFPDDVEKQMLSPRRLAFLCVDYNATMGLPRTEKPPAGARDIVFFESDTPLGEDPDLIQMYRNDKPVLAGRLKWGWVRLVKEALPGFEAVIRRIELSLGDGRPPVTFRLIGGGSRLSWGVFKLLQRQGVVPPAERERFCSSMIDEHMEPLPPGTMAELTREVTSDRMLDAVVSYIENKTAHQLSQQLAAESEINQHLENLAEALRRTSQSGSLPETLMLQVRALARAHIVEVNGVRRRLLPILEEIAGDMLVRDVASRSGGALPKDRPNQEDYKELAHSASFRGFAAFNIAPTQNFIYSFEFSSLGQASANNLFMKGSIGGFRMSVAKLDPKTRTDADPSNFPKQEFIGCLISGGAGVALDGLAFNAPGGRMIKCEVRSFVNLEPKEFLNARFVFFANQKPTFKVTGGPSIGFGNDFHETVFSLTLPSHLPPTTLETVIESPFLSFNPKTPTFADVVKHAGKIKEAIDKKDPKKVPAAQFNATLYALSLCCGVVLQKLSRTQARPDETERTADKISEAPVNGNVEFRAAVFPKQSAVLLEGGHERLEVSLAVNRKLLEYPGWLYVEGLASPEWTTTSRAVAREKNRELSVARAETVNNAIMASLGDQIVPETKSIFKLGRGFEPFTPVIVDRLEDDTPATLLDPFCPDARTAAGQKRLSEEQAKYRELRRVDVVVNGVFTLRMRGG